MRYFIWKVIVTHPYSDYDFSHWVRRIILNNPKKRNALSLSMLESLRENILTEVDSDDLRVIILSGG